MVVHPVAPAKVRVTIHRIVAVGAVAMAVLEVNLIVMQNKMNYIGINKESFVRAAFCCLYKETCALPLTFIIDKKYNYKMKIYKALLEMTLFIYANSSQVRKCRVRGTEGIVNGK